jgi:hypothetical protein
MGLKPLSRAHLALRTGDGLRRRVLEQTFGLKLRDTVREPGLRDMLARHALRSGTVKGDAATTGRRLSAQDRRAQAATLASLRRVPRNDHRLVAEIAAHQVGARGCGLPALRLQLLRRFVEGTATAKVAVTKPQQPRFDLAEFVAEVRNFARQCAQGWRGNRKALVSHVFPALADAHPEWGLDVIRFKSLLADAHRSGRLSLGTADLRNRTLLDELQASAIAYRNMILHFIRVEDETSDAA